MTRHSADLFKTRSTTRDFLFSSADDTAGKGEAANHATDGCDADGAPLSAMFPDMLDRQGLALTLDSAPDTVGRLCVIAARFGPAPGHAVAEQAGPGETGLTDAVTSVADVCRQAGGLWARIGRCRFAYAFPSPANTDGHLLAKRMQAALPDPPTTSLTVGVAYYPIDNHSRSQIIDNAEKALHHAEFFGPGSITEFDAVSLNISGDRLYQEGNIQGAIGEFQKGLRIDPADTNLLNSLGVCYGVLEDYTNALTAFETAIWLAPDELMPVYNKGFVFLRQGRSEQALDCFLAANKLEPNVFEVVFHIGQIHMEAGAAKKARPYLEAATWANNRSSAAYRHLGACLDRLEMTKEAIQAYKAVVKINPEDAASLSMLGRLYAKRGESLDVAQVMCEQSVRIAPDNGLFRQRLGRVYLELGQLDTALAEFELASALGHDSRAEIEATQDRMMAAKAS